MALNVKTFVQLLQDQVASIQSKSTQLVDFTVGSVLRSISEANAAVMLWLQGLVLQVLTMARLSTSSGVDVDSWVNDWGVTRLAATLSAGQVTFSRFTPTLAAVVPLGAQVQTGDGTQTFQVVLDATNSAWSLTSNGYLLPVGVASVAVPVQSMAAGSSANVTAGTITTLFTSIVGVDTVSNLSAFAGGTGAETDAALKARFVQFIGSLSKSTTTAILYAVQSLQLGVQATIIENQNIDGSSNPGFVLVTINDGTGYPPALLIAAAQNAVNFTRAAGVNFAVAAPIATPAAINCAITTGVGYDHNSVVAVVAAATLAFVKSLPLGAGLPFTKMAQIIYESSPGITNVSSLTINNSTGDIVANPRQAIIPSTITVI